MRETLQCCHSATNRPCKPLQSLKLALPAPSLVYLGRFINNQTDTKESVSDQKSTSGWGEKKWGRLNWFEVGENKKTGIDHENQGAEEEEEGRPASANTTSLPFKKIFTHWMHEEEKWPENARCSDMNVQIKTLQKHGNSQKSF